MSETFVLRLVGGEAELGQVPAADVARLILGAERVLARAAGHVRGRTTPKTGRRGKLIETAVRWRLVAVEQGSVSVILAAPPQASYEFMTLGLDAATLTDEAIRETARALRHPRQPPHRDVARELVKLGDELGVGVRYQALTFSHPTIGARPLRLTPLIGERLRLATDVRPPSHEDEVVGRLVEADFERHTARLRTIAGGGVEVTFAADWEDVIQEALRGEASVAGEVAYDPDTSTARTVRLRHLTRSEQLTAGLEPGEFRETIPVHRLAAASGIGPISDASTLQIEASDEEIDAFIAAIGQ